MRKSGFRGREELDDSNSYLCTLEDGGCCDCLSGPLLCKHVRAVARVLGGLERFGLSVMSRILERVAGEVAADADRRDDQEDGFEPETFYEV